MKMEDRVQRRYYRGQRTENREQSTEDTVQGTQYRGQRTEDSIIHERDEDIRT